MENTNKRRSITQTWVLASIAALLFNIVLLYQYRGIGPVLMVALVVYSLIVFKRTAGVALHIKFYIMAVYTLALSGVFMVTTVPVIRFWSGFIVLTLLFAMAFSNTKFHWVEWLKNTFVYFGGAMTKFPAYFKVGRIGKGRDYKHLKQVALGLVIAIPLLLVAIGLLISADAVFSDMVENLVETIENFFEIETEIEFGKGLWRVVVFFLMAPFFYGLGLYIQEKAPSKTQGEVEVIVSPKVQHRFIAPTVSGTVLVLLNMVYIIFAYVQIRFLFFADIDTGVYDYAGYAREGFFELVTMSILNTMGILFINGFTRSHLFNRIALSITVACTHIMIASSTYKMYLYESTYGYTQLRLYVYFILGFMVVFMVLITLNIWQPSYRVIEWSIVIGLTYFLVISYVNVDDIIVKRNIEHYDNQAQIDLQYLTTLSDDAMPRLIDFMNTSDQGSWGNMEMSTYEDRLRIIEEKKEYRSFFEYNIRYNQAYKAMQKDLLFNE